MTTAIDPGVSTIEHLDFVPVCESKTETESCEQEADFILACKGCSKTVFVCQHHLGSIKQLFRQHLILRCVNCAKASCSFDDAVEVTPL